MVAIRKRGVPYQGKINFPLASETKHRAPGTIFLSDGREHTTFFRAS